MRTDGERPVDQGNQARGYVTDTAYTASFFRELSPVWLNYVAALNGARMRELEAPFNYLELGCGYGQSALVHAAAFPHACFHACDLNASHIASARRAATAFQIDNIHFHEASFETLLNHTLPSFDFIVLHGVYSWVDAQARQAVRKILHAKLERNGLAYASYNCLPGWASEVPLRKLLVEFAATESGDSVHRSERALQTLLHLSEGKLQYLTANPLASAALAAYQRAPLNYLVHEFMNQSWEPFYGVDVADELSEIGLAYVGSATLAENHPMLLMDDRTAASIAALPTERQRRLATDCATNQRFRRDVFIRGELPRSSAATSQQLATMLIGCLRTSDLARLSIRVPRGELTLQQDFMDELRELLIDGPLPMKQAISSLHREGRDVVGITRNLLFLIAGGGLLPCATSAPPAPSMPPRRYANDTVRLMMADIVERGGEGFIPSRVLGNGVKVQALEALAVEAVLQDVRDAAALTTWLDRESARRGMVLTVRVGESSSDIERSAYLREFSQRAFDDLLPALLQLGILV